MKRLAAIDVTRGLAVVCMVLHHTVDSWVPDAERDSLFFAVLRHIGGIPAPAFMFLAGVSSGLVAARERDRGASRRARAWSGTKRGLYILGIAFVFRIFCFIAGGNRIEYWPILFRVDILNCMGVALALASVIAAFARTSRQTVVTMIVVALAFGLATPFLTGVHFDFPSELLGNYIYGSGMLVLFPLFPWMAYLAVGYALGDRIAEALRRVSDEPLPNPPPRSAPGRESDRATIVGEGSGALPGTEAVRGRSEGEGWGGVRLGLIARPWITLGLCLFLAGLVMTVLPFQLYPPHDYWHDSPWWVLMRIGVQVLLLAGFSVALGRNQALVRRVGFLELLGRHSLLAYFAHVELVYGRATTPLHRAVSTPITLCGVAVLIAGCGVLAYGADWLGERRRRPFAPRPAPPTGLPVPESSAG